jgi:nitrogen fixation protein FixH
VRGQVSAAAEATLVEVVAQDGDGRPPTGLTATARLVHPTDRRADHVVPLDEGAPGTFRGATVPVAGQWALVIELSRDGARLFRSKNRVFIR